MLSRFVALSVSLTLNASLLQADVQHANYPAWEHYQDYGRWESRVWHSELCGDSCGFTTAVFDWVDARSGGQKAPSLGDDDLFDVDLPFEFPFYGKTAILSRLSRCPSR